MVAYEGKEGDPQIILQLLKNPPVSCLFPGLNHVAETNGKSDIRIMVDHPEERFKYEPAVSVITEHCKGKMVRPCRVDLLQVVCIPLVGREGTRAPLNSHTE